MERFWLWFYGVLGDLPRYRKAFVAVVGSVLTWGLLVYPDTPVWGLASAVATALGVYRVANEPDDRGDTVLTIAAGVFLGGLLLYFVVYR